jgi:iron complex outermembrane recepter protein
LVGITKSVLRLDKKLYTEVSLFSTQIENLLVARRTANDQYVGINAGSSSHPGFEFLMNYKILESKKFQITPYFSGSLNHFKFKDFVDGVNDYSGNELTGVPNKQLNFGLDAYTKYGFSINAYYRIVGAIPMNDANTKYTEAYSLLDIKTIYAFKIFKVLRTELNAGVNNALNEKYAASIVPNAVGFGAVPPRYYYPGNPVNYYGGFSISYLF